MALFIMSYTTITDKNLLGVVAYYFMWFVIHAVGPAIKNKVMALLFSFFYRRLVYFHSKSTNVYILEIVTSKIKVYI